jgi:hypothetical protein
MSNIDVKKSNAVYKRVSFDGDWSEQCEQRKNRFRYNKKRTFSEGDPSFRGVVYLLSYLSYNETDGFQDERTFN